MKEFIFDRIIDRENICGLKLETQAINKLIAQKKNVVLYAKRNYGKTSLVKNVIIDDFKKKHKKSFIFFADLMGVKDLDSIDNRLKQALEHSIKTSFPLQNLFQTIAKFLTNLKISLAFEPTTSMPEITLQSSKNGAGKIDIYDIFQSVEKISKKIPTLIVIDEFQDIALIKEAEALFRKAFQDLKTTPIIILGSKKHLLKNIFTLPKSPLANFGFDVEIKEIDYNEYHKYIQERFALKKIKITPNDSKFLQNLVARQPEAINILCHEIYQNFSRKIIDKKIILQQLHYLLEARAKRFETLFASLTAAEEKIIIAIAKYKNLQQPQSKDFSAFADFTPRTIKGNIDKLMNYGLVDFDGEKYYICDPLLQAYIKYFR